MIHCLYVISKLKLSIQVDLKDLKVWVNGTTCCAALYDFVLTGNVIRTTAWALADTDICSVLGPWPRSSQAYTQIEIGMPLETGRG